MSVRDNNNVSTYDCFIHFWKASNFFRIYHISKRFLLHVVLFQIYLLLKMFVYSSVAIIRGSIYVFKYVGKQVCEPTNNNPNQCENQQSNGPYEEPNVPTRSFFNNGPIDCQRTCNTSSAHDAMDTSVGRFRYSDLHRESSTSQGLCQSSDLCEASLSSAYSNPTSLDSEQTFGKISNHVRR